MRFDYTNGKTAKYILSIYSDVIADHYYYADLASARKLFNKLTSAELPRGTSVHIYNLKKDVRVCGFYS